MESKEERITHQLGQLELLKASVAGGSGRRSATSPKKKCWLGNAVGAAGGKQWTSGRRRDPDSTETGGFSGRFAEGWRAQWCGSVGGTVVGWRSRQASPKAWSLDGQSKASRVLLRVGEPAKPARGTEVLSDWVGERTPLKVRSG